MIEFFSKNANGLTVRLSAALATACWVAVMLAGPTVVEAEFILAGGSGEGGFRLSCESGDLESPLTPLSEDQPIKTDVKWFWVLTSNDPACSPVGAGGCNNSSSVPGGSHVVSAVVLPDGADCLLLSLHERLVALRLLIPPRPDPLEMLDPPKSAG